MRNTQQPCPDPEAHRLHNKYLGELCPRCGGDGPSDSLVAVIELELGTDGVWAVKP